jgi:hypothetical protein
MWRWARSYDAPAPGMIPALEMMRLKPQTPGFGGLAGRPGTTGPRNTGGWLAPARVLIALYPKPRAKKYNPGYFALDDYPDALMRAFMDAN